MGRRIGTIDTTVYAENYTDQGFGDVRAGMTRAQVTELLGDPLDAGDIHGTDISVHSYTGTPRTPNDRVRVIIYRGDVVVDKRNAYSQDRNYDGIGDDWNINP
jgi:hypothetical protein